MLGCSWRGHLRGAHIHYCPVFLEGTPARGTYSLLPGVLGGDTCEGHIFISSRVFLEGTPVMGTYGFHYCPGVLGGDTYDGYIVHRFHELRVIDNNIGKDQWDGIYWNKIIEDFQDRTTGPANRKSGENEADLIETVKTVYLEAYEVQMEKDLAIKKCKEMKFLMIDTSNLPPHKRAFIERQQAEIMRKYQDVGADDAGADD
ncbi:hypothetical protein Tco_0548139 [Tanacetum coccineum]